MKKREECYWVVNAFRKEVRYQYKMWYRFYKEFQPLEKYMRDEIQGLYRYYSGIVCGYILSSNGSHDTEWKLNIEKYRLLNAYSSHTVFSKDYIKSMCR